MHYLPYIIAILCVLFMASEPRAQDKPRRDWRVTYINDIGQEIRSNTRQSIGGCIATIALQHANEKRQYYCTSDETGQSTQSTAKSTR